MLSYVVVPWFSSIFTHLPHTLAKDKRRLYVLGSIEDVPDTPAAPAAPSHPPQPPSTKAGPDRAQRMTKTARMRTGPLPPHLKERVMAAMANAKPPQVATAPANTSTIRPAAVQTVLVTTPEADAPQVQIDGPGVVAFIDNAPGMAPVLDNPTSTLTEFDSDYVDVEMGDMDPTADPWEVMERPGQEIIVDDDSGMAFSAVGMNVGILPRLGTLNLTETEPPTLLFEDEDIRPDWLMSAVKEFLRYTPYYGGLGKVIDQFLLQEARLGYPNLVNAHISHYSTRMLILSSHYV